MTLTSGNKVVYPCQGPCLIDRTIVRLIDGDPKSFYHLVVLSGHGGELFVPVEKIQTIGVRPLLERSEIPAILEQLGQSGQTIQGWRTRAGAIMSLFKTGSAIDIAEIIRSLTDLRQKKELSTRESWTLDRAKSLLVCEISQVLDEPISEAQARVDKALGPLITKGLTNS